jgi:GNAT superfamily N-acetyltransferase
MPELTITNIEPAHFGGLEALQRACYPTLAEHELMKVEHFRSQHAIFPQGQFVVLDGERVIGQGSGFFIDFDFDHPDHRFHEICDNFYFRNHDPDGAYYYGADISVHPDYQGHGIGKLLYKARKEVAASHNRRGIVAGGMLPGFVHYKQRMSVQEYVARVVAGELFDPTLSFQLKQGFTVRGLLPDYLDDSAADNWATLIVWENPQYSA